MGDIAIRAENLSKQYKIGAARERHDTLRDQLAGGLKALFQRNGQPSRGEQTIWALKDVSFEVKRGEVVGVIGRNGAGKSTLLKILSRITKPTSGRAEIYGRVGSLLEVGTGFHPELTGRENIYLNGAILGMSRGEIGRKFDEIVAFADIEKFIDTPVKRYSSGMYVRLAFAVAAHLEPEILLVDEVLAVGDAEFQKKCLGKMGDIAKQGRTVLFVSHNVGAINDLCSRSVLLENGVVVIDGPSEQVVQTYVSQGASMVPVVHLESIESDAYFISLSLHDPDEMLRTVFDIRKSITIFLEFALRRQIGGLQIGMAVLNSKGDRIFYSSSAYADPPVLFGKVGTHYVSASIPGKLLPPGKYFINVALHRPKTELYDLREHVLSFEVEETGSGRYEYPPHAMGHVLVDVRWAQRAAIR